MDKIRSVEPGWLHTTDSVPNYSIKRASSVVCTHGLTSSPHEALETLSDMVRAAGMDGAVVCRYIWSVGSPERGPRKAWR